MKPFRIAINLLALIAVLGMAALGALWYFANGIFGGEDPATKTASLTSPDGKFRAIQATGSGGGAAGWCNDFIVVQSSAAPEIVPTYGQALSDGLVFAASCEQTSATMTWSSPTLLLVHFTPSPGKLASFSLRDSDKSGNVKVQIVFEKSEF
jgi:hypothetical protein